MTNGKDVMINVILVTRTTNFRHSDEKLYKLKTQTDVVNASMRRSQHNGSDVSLVVHAS